MRIKLQTVSELRHYFGDGEIEVEFAGSAVSTLLEQLKKEFRFDIVSQKYTMLFVNGKGCVDFSRTLKDGDRIAIVPIMAAG